MTFWMWIMCAYIIGSIPFGVLIPAALGQGDPRTIGSGNIGSTNVYRLAGIRTAMLVYICDVLKGAIPTWLASPNQRSYVALACVIGHVFSIFLKGKGGKGVATACGVLLVLMPKALFLAVLVWFIIWKTTHFVSLASLIACSIILLMGWIDPDQNTGLFSLCLFALLVWSHRANIVRLAKGQESKVQKK
jgi:glycerol-3-phosphate acyltransferase PlsY